MTLREAVARVPWRTAFWFTVLAGLWFALRHPDVGPPLFPFSDKLQHATAFATLAFFGHRAGYRRLAHLALGLIALGIGIELLQLLTPWRSAEVADVVADACGVGIACVWLRRAPTSGEPGEDGR